MKNISHHCWQSDFACILQSTHILQRWNLYMKYEKSDMMDRHTGKLGNKNKMANTIFISLNTS